MSVRLLPKSELNALKVKETMREQAEGLKLATRVDGLRHLYSKTEQDLEKYRTATLEAIGKEIGKLEEKKNALTAEFRAMKSKYDSLMPEISTKRVELSQFEKSLRAWEKKLIKREEKSALDELDVMEANEKASLSLSRQEDNERISRNLLIEASEKKSEAEQTLREARKMQDKTASDQKDVEAALVVREFSIQASEKRNMVKSMELMKKEKEFNQREIRINDQRDTLARSMERLKANRQP